MKHVLRNLLPFKSTIEHCIRRPFNGSYRYYGEKVSPVVRIPIGEIFSNNLSCNTPVAEINSNVHNRLGVGVIHQVIRHLFLIAGNCKLALSTFFFYFVVVCLLFYSCWITYYINNNILSNNQPNYWYFQGTN